MTQQPKDVAWDFEDTPTPSKKQIVLRRRLKHLVKAILIGTGVVFGIVAYLTLITTLGLWFFGEEGKETFAKLAMIFTMVAGFAYYIMEDKS